MLSGGGISQPTGISHRTEGKQELHLARPHAGKELFTSRPALNHSRHQADKGSILASGMRTDGLVSEKARRFQMEALKPSSLRGEEVTHRLRL